MNTKETYLKCNELRHQAAKLDEQLHKAVIEYMSHRFGVESCTSSNDKKGKVCLEEIGDWYDAQNDLVVINYTTMNEYGDFVEEKQIRVSSSEIDKYLK